MTWFLGSIVVWWVLWAILEHHAYLRREKRDKYADYNEGP